MNMDKIKKRFQPLSETAYYILLSLIREQHGYAIMQNVERITNGRIKLGAGTIYGTLGKLGKSRLIKAGNEENRRKIYALTDLGRELLRLEVGRLEELLQNGNKGLKELT